MFLTDDKFLDVIKATPLVAIDLIIKNSSGFVLLGKRFNRPARGFWFVPGGRIRKDETLENQYPGGISDCSKELSEITGRKEGDRKTCGGDDGSRNSETIRERVG